MSVYGVPGGGVSAPSSRQDGRRPPGARRAPGCTEWCARARYDERGEVNTGDFDDLEALAALCKMYGAWLHVDGAFGLFAACDPARSHLLRGLSSKTDRKVSKGRSRATPSRSSVRHRDR